MEADLWVSPVVAGAESLQTILEIYFPLLPSALKKQAQHLLKSSCPYFATFLIADITADHILYSGV
jgi:hypothetical protein